MPELILELKPSVQFRVLILATLFGTLGVIIFLPCTIAIKIGLGLFSVIYTSWIYWSHGLLGNSRSIVKIMVAENGWMIADHRRLYPAQLEGQTTVTNWVTICRFKIDNTKKNRSCVIFHDALDRETYRRFLVVLHNGKIG